MVLEHCASMSDLSHITLRGLPDNVPGLSHAGVPGVAAFESRGAQPLTEPFQAVTDGQLRYEFHALVAELAGEPQPGRPAVAHGQFTTI